MSLETLEARWVLAGPAGSLDASFGAAGTVVGQFNIPVNIPADVPADVETTSMAIQGDGKIVIAGTIATATHPNQQIFVGRFNVDGSLDTSFGVADGVLGYTVFDWGGQQSFSHGMTIDPSRQDHRRRAGADVIDRAARICSCGAGQQWRAR